MKWQILRWRLRGRQVPPPDVYKQELVTRYGKRFGLDIFVETGTFQGEMLEAQRSRFGTLYSVELDRQLYKAAATRFRPYENIHVVPGDSAFILPFILNKLKEPALFWLDAHQMVGGVSGEKITPIEEELGHILAHDVEGHVILIDDARLFRGGGYPTLQAIASQIAERFPHWVFEVHDDIIRSHEAVAKPRKK